MDSKSTEGQLGLGLELGNDSGGLILMTRFIKKHIKYLNFKEKINFKDYNPSFQNIRDKTSKVWSYIYHIRVNISNCTNGTVPMCKAASSKYIIHIWKSEQNENT